MLDDPLIPDLPLDAWPVWARALFWFWIAVFGAAIGSFLNVVIYRAPRGMSLVHPGSHCPRCGHGIRARDNLPVVGWLILRGKCRDCDAAISARYPLVEALVGLLFLGLSSLYLGMRGASLPQSMSDLTFPNSEQRLAGIAAYHLVLVTFLLCAAGMRIDGQSLPRWLIFLVAAVGLLLPCIWPWLRPLDSSLPAFGSAGSNAFAAGLVGAVVGGIAGRLRSGSVRLLRGTARKSIGDPRLYAVIGAMLGWQAVLAVALLASILGLIVDCAGKVSRRLPTWPDEVGLLLAVLLLLGGWRWEIDSLSRLGLDKWLLVFIAIIVIAAISAAELALRGKFDPTPAPARSRRKKKR